MGCSLKVEQVAFAGRAAAKTSGRDSAHGQAGCRLVVPVICPL